MKYEIYKQNEDQIINLIDPKIRSTIQFSRNFIYRIGLTKNCLNKILCHFQFMGRNLVLRTNKLTISIVWDVGAKHLRPTLKLSFSPRVWCSSWLVNSFSCSLSFSFFSFGSADQANRIHVYKASMLKSVQGQSAGSNKCCNKCELNVLTNLSWTSIYSFLYGSVIRVS